ncbi:MAG: glycosyltransferase A (GT-A) superfamily protein (DUF2064 family) [Flammeovirgaceae bacterium]|jgi:glycosyltransferase A (GT-A) superfamily protein (DUF2064 family)
MSDQTGILIFTHSANRELKKIPQSAELFEALNSDILRKVEKIKQDYFVYDEQKQVGNTFGEKITNAVESIFQKGYQFVITVGNDTPELSVNQLRKAVQNSSEGKLTFGPSTDGGFYLMTFDKAHFDKEKYASLNWTTRSLAKEFITSIQTEQIIFLQYLQDIDFAKDLLHFGNQHDRLSELVREVLLRILVKKHSFYSKSVYLRNTFNHRISYNKGSPLQFYRLLSGYSSL